MSSTKTIHQFVEYIEKYRLDLQIEDTHRQIDQLVYGLYDLSDEEIRIIE